MTRPLDETHDASARSWVTSANRPGTDFPLQNLPLGVFCRRGSGNIGRIGVAIGDEILDLCALAEADALGGIGPEVAGALRAATLNELMALGRPGARAVRRAAFALLREGSAVRSHAAGHLVPAVEAECLLPASVGDYTDFYASIHHATNVGRMFRPDNPLLPNYKWVPIGYHGRASSVIASGTGVLRPIGQTKEDAAPAPAVGPSRSLDYECEVGAWVGKGNLLGSTVPIAEARDHLFGLCLVNDWSARDLQRWEYQPLGPFLAKNFGTTVSPWVVTQDALEPFRVPRSPRPEGDPEPLPYLDGREDRVSGGYGITLEVYLRSAVMRDGGLAPMRLTSAGFGDMYWTMAQLLTHHAGNGCNLRPGDLLASGTVSGAEKSERGCLLELTARGTEPLTLPTGESRRFLEDGDEVILRGRCEREGFAGIGFGECRGIVLPAQMLPG
ncbi:MAG: fumarylacetoacetase [Gemmatimonadales bacterium]|nr:fumarylacetoacetase [Gemmatimonadales bacterium]